MFTGIIQGIAVVKSLEQRPGLARIGVEFPEHALDGVARGASISIDGVCLTVSDFLSDTAFFDVMGETLRVTTLDRLELGSKVNFERAASANAEVGGHVLSGHVDCVAEISSIQTPENNFVITFKVPHQWFQYIFSKGYIAINGTSLTITNARRDTHTFEVWLIPETLRLTTFGNKRVGDSVNIEIERQTQVIVDTVNNFLVTNFKDLMATKH